MTYKRLVATQPKIFDGADPCCELRPDTDAPARARAFVDRVLARCPDEMRMRARHVVTELVTNSVQHARSGPIVVEAHVAGPATVDIDVRDQGPGFDVPPRAPGHDDPTGWGLMFVDLLSESWAPGGLGSPIVWCHFEPRELDYEPERIDPLLDERVRDLLDVRMLLESVKDYAIFGLDRSGRITLWSAGAERQTGYTTDDVLGLSVAVLHEDFDVREELARALAHGRQATERWLRRRDGSCFWADSVVTPIMDHTAVLRGFSVVARDVTWRKRLDEDREGLIARIRHLARTDDLTELPNRRGWHEELDREMARARRRGTQLCVAMVDLDGFKGYNDEHGHLAGDSLLQLTARSWSTALRATDLLARYGGDEFSVILPDCPQDEAVMVVERLRDATPGPATCSVGLACSDGAEATEVLVRRADSALYRAKRDGRNLTAIG